MPSASSSATSRIHSPSTRHCRTRSATAARESSASPCLDSSGWATAASMAARRGEALRAEWSQSEALLLLLPGCGGFERCESRAAQSPSSSEMPSLPYLGLGQGGGAAEW
eukprot:7382040-Prymnesium_polylepis.1